MSNQIFPALPGIGIAIKRSPVYATTIQTAASGKELRASWWSYPRWNYEIPLNFARMSGFSAQTVYDEMQSLAGMFADHQGRWDSFLFTDPADSTVSGMGFGVGTGSATTFQLQRTPGGQYQDALGSWPNYTVPRTNLLTYSAQVDLWTQSATTTTANAALAPDGTPTADKVVEDATTAYHYASGAAVVVSGTTYTASVYIKAAERTFVALAAHGLANGTAFFDLTNAVVGACGASITNSTITPAGNGWYRCTITYTAAAGTTGLDVLPEPNGTGGSYAGTVGYGVYAWGAQIETGTTATEYIPTTSAAVTSAPSYWPAAGSGFEPILYPNPASVQVFRQDWQGNQLMYPTARSNRIATQNTTGGTNFVTVAASPLMDPMGLTGAVRITDTGGINAYFSKPFVTAQAGLHVFSIWIAGGTNLTSSIGVFDNILSTAQTIVSTNIISGPGSAVLVGNVVNLSGLIAGTWTKVQIVVSGLAAATTYQTLVDAHTAGGSAGSGYVDAFGWQAEAGTSSTSWISTAGTAVTVTDYTLSLGVVTFAVAPLLNAILTWTGSFWRRVRFDQDSLTFEQIVNLVWKGGSIKLASVK